ncbi:MAG: alpha/beta fold hydrolase [Actinomycetota bacterium]
MPKPPKQVRKARRALRAAGIIGASVVAGAGAVALGGAITARTITKRDARNPDPYADTPYGDHRFGRRTILTSHDGTKLHMDHAGKQGPLLVFSHGFSLNSSVWFHQFEELSDDHRLLAYDLRGHGMSEVPATGDWSLEALGRDLLAVIDAETGDDPIVLVGHSMGGMVTVQALSERPELLDGKVRGLILSDTGFGEIIEGMLRYGPPALRAMIRPALQNLYKTVGQHAGRLERVRGRGTDLEYAWARLVGFGPRPSHAHVRFMTQMLRSVDSEVWVKLLPLLLELELRHHLESIKVPVLMTVGSHDRLTPVPVAEVTASKFADCELHVIQRSGHTPMLEKPDEWNALVRDFTKRLFES